MIEKGSISSFLSGKAYKRSKRLHQLLALAILHFNSSQLTLEGECLLEIEDLKMCILPNEIQSIDKNSIGEKSLLVFLISVNHTETELEMEHMEK